MRIKILGGKITNSKAIDKEVGKSKEFQKNAEDLARKKFKQAKTQFLDEFDNHSVTKEIEGGPNGSNISGTLVGYGNLFSFIGFEESANPTQAVRNFLQSFIKMTPSKKARGAIKEFNVNIPNMKDFNFAKMPWESGNNWVRSVEMGISNFSYYMNKASKASRSGKGIQIDNKIRGGSSKGVPYMTEMLNKLKERLRRK
tara:strand:+ start:4112 stop:4708 length:597 start_codon:yes stop_codon:yes gene_type:complete